MQHNAAELIDRIRDKANKLKRNVSNCDVRKITIFIGMNCLNEIRANPDAFQFYRMGDRKAVQREQILGLDIERVFDPDVCIVAYEA